MANRGLIIIPAYNEVDCIEQTVQDIQERADGFDYVIINDCSTDETLEICRKRGFHVLNLPVNLGIGGAVQTGYIYARENGYEMAVQVDADGQHDVAFLAAMAEKMVESGADFVVGSRFIEKEGFQSSILRRAGISFFTSLIRLLTGKKITDPTSGFRLANYKVIAEFARNYPRDYPEPESLVALLRRRYMVEEVPVIMRERQGGISSIHMRASVYYMIKVSLAILVEWIRK